MARKETITKQMILEGAFEILREDGIELVTARKLASKIGCSTQPIFRLYDGMEDLLKELYIKAKDYYDEFVKKHEAQSEIPFVAMAQTYVLFAKEEQNIFKLLFLSSDREHTIYEVVNGGENAYVMKELKKIPNLKMDKAEDIFTKIFIFMQGLASMTICGEFDVTEEETEAMFKEVISGFIKLM